MWRPEEATNWDDFLERIAQERSATNDRLDSFPPFFWVSLGALLLVVSLLFMSYAAGWHGLWWEWLVAIAPLVVLGRMVVVAAGRAESDAQRLRELDRLELAWKSHLERRRAVR